MEGIAYKTLCNNLCIWIDEIINDIDGKITFHYTNDKKHTVKIYYTTDGRAFFKAWGEKHFFDEFTKAQEG